jgi:prepilin-type N-terminal cleavage/methylation domain-containing protein
MEDVRRSGFTLLELLVTLALVGSLAGLAIPAMGRWVETARLHSAAESLYQELQRARNHALTHGLTVYFSISAAGERWCYAWGELPTCDCRANESTVSACHSGATAGEHTYRRLSSDFPSVELNTTRPARSKTLRFSAVRGTASADSFVLRNRAGELRVVLSPLGRVRICATHQRRYPAC